MSVATGEKRFVIKHVFKEFKSWGPVRIYEGPRETHYDIPWRIRVVVVDLYAYFCFDCLKSQDNSGWKINTTINGKYSKKGGVVILTAQKCYPEDVSIPINHFKYEKLSSLIDGNLAVELEVKIDQISGIYFRKLRNFDDDAAKEFSDVTLTIGDRHFHVHKSYLCVHSVYFKSLFSGNFAESQKPKIELKGIDPDDFQHFLELIYGECSVEAHPVLGILRLADFFDSKTAIRRCEEFLVEKSDLSLKVKFDAATKYKLEKLKEKCLSEIKTTADILSIIPQDPNQFDGVFWKELLLKSTTFASK